MALFEMNQISPDWFGDRVVPPTGYCVLPGLSWWPVLNFDWLWSWSCFPMSTKEESVKFLRSTSSLKFYRFLVFSTSDLPVWKRTTRTVAADWSAMVSSHVTHGPRRGRGSARAGHSIGGGVFRNVKFPIHILKWPYPLRCSFTFASGFFFFLLPRFNRVYRIMAGPQQGLHLRVELDIRKNRFRTFHEYQRCPLGLLPYSNVATTWISTEFLSLPSVLMNLNRVLPG